MYDLDDLEELIAFLLSSATVIVLLYYVFTAISLMGGKV